MKYPEIALKALINTIGEDESAYKWLTTSKWKELAAFYDVLFFQEPTAINPCFCHVNDFFRVKHFIFLLLF